MPNHWYLTRQSELILCLVHSLNQSRSQVFSKNAVGDGELPSGVMVWGVWICNLFGYVLNSKTRSFHFVMF